MSKVKNLICSTDAFRCVFIFLMMFALIYKADVLVGPYVKFIVLPWGYFLLLRSFFWKRALQKMKYVWALLAFLGLYTVTIFINRAYFVENMKIFMYMVLLVLVVCPPDTHVSHQNKCRWVFVFNCIFLLAVTIMSAMSLWSQVVLWHYHALEWWGYAADGRLKGFYRNTNVGGIVSFIAIGMLLINWTLITNFRVQNKIKRVAKVICAILLPLHFAMLTLTSSRTARYSLLVFVLLFSFCLLLRYFSTRLSSVAKSGFAAALAAVLVTGAVYAADYPTRVGVAYLQAAATSARVQPAAYMPVGVMMAANLTATSGAAVELDIVEREYDGAADTGRLSLYRLGWEIIKRNPVLGVSPAGLLDATFEMGDVMGEDTVLRLSNNVANAGLHNLYIQLAATNGIPGLIIFLLFLLLFAMDNLKKLFSALHLQVYLTVAGILSLCASMLFLSLFETRIFLVTSFDSVVFWSMLSFAAFFLRFPDTGKGSES